jgi:transposase
MIQITPQMRILVAIQPADFRRGIDGLARICKDALADDPCSGAVFVFRNRRATAIKALVYDGIGDRPTGHLRESIARRRAVE